jgi:hypothetical protein
VLRLVSTPLNIAFSDFAPAMSTNGKSITLVDDENLNVRVPAFTVPRVFAMLDTIHLTASTKRR